MSAFKEARDFYKQKKREEKRKKKLLGKKATGIYLNSLYRSATITRI